MTNPLRSERGGATLMHVLVACFATNSFGCQASSPSSTERSDQRPVARAGGPAEDGIYALVGHEAPRPPPQGWSEVLVAMVGSIPATEPGKPSAQSAASIGVMIWSRGTTRAVLMDMTKPGSQGAKTEVVDTVLVELGPHHMLTDLCEKNGVPDPELLAEVESDPGQAPYYTTKGATFRLNRTSRKIERIEASGIRCAVRSFGVGFGK
jgi:hypothetical protein